MNLTEANRDMVICQGPEGGDMLELYNEHLGPYLADHCLELCEKFKYKGSMSASGPETTPIEVCYWIESNDILYNEEYLIYDLKVIVGSIGGTLGLFLGFSLTGIVSRICRAIKANLKE